MAKQAVVKASPKTPQSYIDPLEIAIPDTYIASEHDLHCLRKPKDPEWRQRLIHTLYRWVDREESLEINQFCMHYKLPYQTLNNWIDEYPELKSAYTNVKLHLATKRRMGAVHKKFSETMILRDLHLYDPEWHFINKYHKDMSTDDKNVPTTFNIVISKPEVITPEQLKGEIDAIE